jgi:phage host-nuclease inhibitor protein Gam
MKIKSWDDVDLALAEIAEQQGAIAQAKSDVDEAKEAIADLEPEIESFVREHEEDLLERSRAFENGRVWLRKAKRLGLIGRWSWRKVLDGLIEAKRRTLIRTKREVDKEALEQLTDDQLAELRVKRVTEDVFGYEAT